MFRGDTSWRRRGRGRTKETGASRYLRHLWTSKRAAPTATDALERPYRDYLQAPLQPLADDLETATYETFEKDPVKYARYEAAARAFFRARGSSEVVAAVAGAGRGPLVQAALNAADAEGVTIRVHAVEKNANAVVTLRGRARTEDAWRGRVEVHAADARGWTPPDGGVDCLISELLGSFGDNELSPECLAPAEAWLKPGGVSIPYRYESFAQPISRGDRAGIDHLCRRRNIRAASAAAPRPASAEYARGIRGGTSAEYPRGIRGGASAEYSRGIPAAAPRPASAEYSRGRGFSIAPAGARSSGSTLDGPTRARPRARPRWAPASGRRRRTAGSRRRSS